MIPPLTNQQQFESWVASNIKIPNIRKKFIAGTAITGGTGVYMNVDGKVYPYTTSNQDTYIGIAEKTTALDCEFVVVLQGYLKVTGSGWLPGVVYSIQNGGSLTTFSADKKVAVGVGQDAIIVYTDLGNGGSGPAQSDGYAKSLMLMGG